MRSPWCAERDTLFSDLLPSLLSAVRFRSMRILEVISTAGFERFFGELIDLGGIEAEPQRLGDLCARYGLEMDPAASRRSSSISSCVSPENRYIGKCAVLHSARFDRAVYG